MCRTRRNNPNKTTFRSWHDNSNSETDHLVTGEKKKKIFHKNRTQNKNPQKKPKIIMCHWWLVQQHWKNLRIFLLPYRKAKFLWVVGWVVYCRWGYFVVWRWKTDLKRKTYIFYLQYCCFYMLQIQLWKCITICVRIHLRSVFTLISARSSLSDCFLLKRVLFVKNSFVNKYQHVHTYVEYPCVCVCVCERDHKIDRR